MEIKRLKENLFDKRLKLANRNKSEPWNLNDLEMVLKTLKQGKSRDPNGWVRDLFFSDIAGKDFKVSILTTSKNDTYCLQDMLIQPKN